MKNILYIAAALSFAAPTQLSAHCQVPCGIFDDQNVIDAMGTDVVTIEKAAQQIVELSKDPAANAQQIVRWTNNKESHAQSIQEKVLNYFLAQRLKLPETDADKELYAKKLALSHEVIVAAMKCKQSTDPATVAKLKELMVTFGEMFGSHE
ncbi:MAG: superoxide dismutase, Ni [Akkermansiaceae bacterium]|nr:superoxide dismutase, Ni [Akkermansiaceae bacterium]MDP4720218.1 superoxide dismutase, Ni [Akkermansiaceae bacterium]MDP4780502.1 superoxide dismutase, Ni [Akkermansiaceae bacterium]MDP4847199.1 superoxide dismutase, Ni [Akkermansiaceae bacterium]MDP4897945.1 superoxide dismutase, Ni [Akkermansiaceae bacterium]